MKRIVRKIHHFSKKELALEEIVIITIVCLLTTGAFAAKILIPIRAGIIQCGHREDLPDSCRRDTRCCLLLEQAGMSEPYTSQNERPPYPLSNEPALNDGTIFTHDENAPNNLNIE